MPVGYNPQEQPVIPVTPVNVPAYQAAFGNAAQSVREGEYLPREENGPFNEFGINRNKDTYAQQTLAALYRSQYEDYKDRFRPIEDILFGATSPGFAINEGNRAYQSFQSGFDQSQQSNARELQSFGLTMTPEQKRLAESRRALGGIQAQNQAQRQAAELGQQVLGLGTRERFNPQ